jgi:hypothetical protein
VSTNGITNPTNARLVLADSARARRLATYPRACACARMRSASSPRTEGLPFSAREIVAVETPRSRAISTTPTDFRRLREAIWRLAT